MTRDEANVRLRRLLAIRDFGEEISLDPDEVLRLQELDSILQDRELQIRGAVFVEELVNHYHCEDCDESWSDAWCCACDDECPRCLVAHSPEDSDVVGVAVVRINVDRCAVCGQVHEF